MGSCGLRRPLPHGPPGDRWGGFAARRAGCWACPAIGAALAWALVVALVAWLVTPARAAGARVRGRASFPCSCSRQRAAAAGARRADRAAARGGGAGRDRRGRSRPAAGARPTGRSSRSSWSSMRRFPFASRQQVGPQGDEPHYLMVADSLLRDGDVSLERDYAAGPLSGVLRRPARARTIACAERAARSTRCTRWAFRS